MYIFKERYVEHGIQMCARRFLNLAPNHSAKLIILFLQAELKCLNYQNRAPIIKNKTLDHNAAVNLC